MTDEQAKELMEIVSKEFWEGAIEQLVLMKDQSLKIVTNIKENIKEKGKLDGNAEYGFVLAIDCFEEVMNGYIKELKKEVQNDRKE